jgi:hypothetical protein
MTKILTDEIDQFRIFEFNHIHSFGIDLREFDAYFELTNHEALDIQNGLVISFLFLSRINEQSAHHMSIVLVVFSSD